MSEPIKYTYRSFYGIFVITVLSILTAIGGALLVIGVIVIVFSWFPLIFPEFLEIYRINFLNTRIIDPNSAFLLFFATGLTILAVSLIILGIDFYLLTAVKIIDQDMSKFVDTYFPSIKGIFSTKGKGILILGILLFGTFVVFLSLIL